MGVGAGVVGPGISVKGGGGGGGSGTVTSVSVVTADGFAGTVATSTTTPAISLSTTVTGILAGNGTSVSAAATTGTGGTVVLSASPALTGVPTAPTAAAGDNSTQIATDAFVTTAVNNAIAGVNPAVAVSAATVAASDTSAWTYNNGVAGVGATFTGPVNTPITIDGVLFNSLTQSLLVKNDTQSPSGAFNGIYTLTALQTSLTGAVFTRRLDYDTPSDMNNTGAIPVVGGTANGTTSWVLTSNVTTVGTSPLVYTQFTLAPSTLVTTATLLTGTGNPNTNVSGGPTAGTLNQMYQNLTATGNNDWLWRCSTGGTGGAGGTAVWVGKL